MNNDGDVLDLRMMSRGRITFKSRCNLNDNRGIRNMLDTLKIKFNLDLEKIAKTEKKIEEDWF